VAKRDGGKNPVEKARRKLGRAQLAFNAAQERHAEARVRGKQEVERARLRAAKWQAKAAERVELRAEKVARAEARLLSLSSQAELAESTTSGSLSSSDGVADLEALAEMLDGDQPAVITPENFQNSPSPKPRRRKATEDAESS
jgi:hypothetical protein